MRVIERIMDCEFESPATRAMRGYARASKDKVVTASLSDFRSIDPLLTEGREDWFIFKPGDVTPQVLWPIRAGVVLERPGGGLFMGMVRSVNLSEVRGKASRVGPFMLRSDVAQEEDGALRRMSDYWVWLGGRWAAAGKAGRGRWGQGAYQASPEIDQAALDTIGVMTSIALRHRYEWAVSLGLDGTPTVRFATDPSGLAAIFRWRDAPAPHAPRAHLMNWVAAHWRQNRNDPVLETYVRRHLRGAMAFVWHGLHVSIEPAPFDLEHRDRLLAEREAMRLTGDDRRSRHG